MISLLRVCGTVRILQVGFVPDQGDRHWRWSEIEGQDGVRGKLWLDQPILCMCSGWTSRRCRDRFSFWRQVRLGHSRILLDIQLNLQKLLHSLPAICWTSRTLGLDQAFLFVSSQCSSLTPVDCYEDHRPWTWSLSLLHLTPVKLRLIRPLLIDFN